MCRTFRKGKQVKIFVKRQKNSVRENTQKSHQNAGPFRSPKRGIQNMGKTSEVINRGHKNETRLFRIIKAENSSHLVKVGYIWFCVEKWELITSDPEVLQTASGMPINASSELQPILSFQVKQP